MSELQIISGRVAAVNAKGLKLEGADSWLNVSQYAKPAPTLPRRGEDVVLGLDSKNFIRTIGITPRANGAAKPAAEHSARNTAQIAEAVTPGEPPSTERRISRQACLNTSIAILSSGGREATLEDVLAVAGTLEKWVHRAVRQ